MELSIEYLEEKLAQARADLERFVKEANLQVAALNGAISLLESILAEQETLGVEEPK
jgi:hypothetical protein